MDEALALPSEYAVKVALRSQQLIAHESGVINTIDPLGGSYYVEAQTNRLEQETYDYFRKIEALGGVIPAIEKGFLQREIAEAAYRYQMEIDTHQRVIVGVNEHTEDEPVRIPLLEMDPEGYEHQVARLERVRRERDNERVGVALEALRSAARGTDNTMPYILDCVRAYATLGEIMGVFRQVFGEYREPTII
jgi:methylmalonyl-CoA mutase N-terminal domain/subunit